MPWIIIAASMMAGTAPEGRPSASIGTKAPDVAELLADSGPATPSMAPWPNRSGCFDRRRSTEYETNDDMTWPGPGMMPMRNPSTVPRPMGAGVPPFLPGGQQLPQPGRADVGPGVAPRREQDLRDAEQAHRHRHDADAVAQLGEPVLEAEEAGHGVHADHAQQQAQRRHGQRLRHRSAAHVREHQQAQDQQREILGRAEAQRELRQRRREQHERDDAQGARDERADRSDGERGPARPFCVMA